MFWLKNKKSIFLGGYTLLTKGLTYAVSEGSDKPAHVHSLATAIRILRLLLSIYPMYYTKLTQFLQTVYLIPIQINSLNAGFFFMPFCGLLTFFKIHFFK